MQNNTLCTLALICAMLGCESRGSNEMIFFDGRAVETVGDTLMAVSRSPQDVVEILNLHTNETQTFGAGQLESPFHVQFVDGTWYVSDVIDGKAFIAVFDHHPDGEPTFSRRTDLSDFTELHHQFAVLPDDRIVVEATDNRLVVLAGDSASTFALTERGPRPSILIGTRGGVLHAVPDNHLTLYNAFGNIRWRTEWPWSAEAYVTDVAVDSRTRIHVLAGIPASDEGMFRVYSLVGETGEVVWWSEPGARATFVVSAFGNVTADSTGRWF